MICNDICIIHIGLKEGEMFRLPFNVLGYDSELLIQLGCKDAHYHAQAFE